MNTIGYPQVNALNIPTGVPQGSSFNIPGLGQGSISIGDNEAQLANSLISTSGSVLGDTVNTAGELGKSAIGGIGKVIIAIVVSVVVLIIGIVLAIVLSRKKKEGFSTYRKYTRPSRYSDIYEMRKY